MISKKDIFINREGDPKAFLELVSKFIEENSAHFSAQDSSRIALGAAMSVVDRVPDPKKTRELLGVVRDWTRGRASDEELKRAENELWDLYYVRRARSARLAAEASRGHQEAATRHARWAISDALVAGAHPQEIIDSIERETGPLDWFLASRR